MSFSPISLGTPEERFGHDTQHLYGVHPVRGDLPHRRRQRVRQLALGAREQVDGAATAWRRMSSSPISLGRRRSASATTPRSSRPGRSEHRQAACPPLALGAEQVPQITFARKRDEIVTPSRRADRQRLVLRPDPGTRLDAELLRQRGPRVAGHVTRRQDGQLPGCVPALLRSVPGGPSACRKRSCVRTLLPERREDRLHESRCSRNPCCGSRRHGGTPRSTARRVVRAEPSCLHSGGLHRSPGTRLRTAPDASP